MNWRNVKLVWRRELTDQLRDRRTLFMVGVLPLMIYPLMAVSFLQVSQFMREHPARVLVIGAEPLAEAGGVPPLIEGDHFAEALFDTPAEAKKVELERAQPARGQSPAQLLIAETARLEAGELDAIVYFPSDFTDRLSALRAELKAYADRDGPAAAPPEVPTPVVRRNTGRDASQVAVLRVDRVLGRWRKAIIDRNLSASRVPPAVLSPFRVKHEDVAEPGVQKAGVWGKLLPFIVFVWALTGAFYPAVDLCAGEKERGTLETLLVSPALRGEIVWGKLLTVITFSMATAVLNLFGIGAMGRFMAQQFAAGPLPDAGALGAPSIVSLLWLLAALPPIAALFSALSLACASFARSTKEGQYYFMPLFLAMMPLMLMPLSPGVELTLGNALVPVMGLVLLLRSLIEGNLLEAARFALPVTVVTAGCCLLAIKWAVSQFNQESVLFRGSERFDLGLWLRKLLRREQETPSVAMAVACVVGVLILQVTARFLLPPPGPDGPTLGYFAWAILASQACVLLPAIFFGGVLTQSPGRTFRLRAPRPAVLVAAVGLALAAHPIGVQLNAWIQALYPASEALQSTSRTMIGAFTQSASPLVLVLLLAVLPAVCEELTFRGCVLTGLRSAGSTRWAVVLTAVAFGFTHTFFQQSLSATVLGVLIGALAVLSGSIWPCIIFHAVYNSLPLMLAYYAEGIGQWLQPRGSLGGLLTLGEEGVTGYSPVVVIAGVLMAGLLLEWIRRLSDGPNAGAEPRASVEPPPPASGLLPTETTEG